jgi:four helix bundle protein
MEADGAESKKDFQHKVAICRKELKETKHWLRMIVAADPRLRGDCRVLWNEAQQLTFIFSAILKKTNA